jgi:hypothetical protein
MLEWGYCKRRTTGIPACFQMTGLWDLVID